MPPATRLVVLLVLLLASAAGPPASAEEAVPVGTWPLHPAPAVVRGFDPPDDPWGAGHRGVDLLGSPGAAVHAALSGTVSFAGRIAGRGVVVVDHGDTRTTYEPVLATVHRGDAVASGAVLGRLTSAASHCPPRTCLHWGWRRGDTYLDPLLLVGGGPVRLLPLWRDAPVGAAALARAPAYAGWRPPRPAYAGLPDGLPLALRPAGAPAGRPAGGGPW
jgi:murein DD-endopeptidase MepM/ murein hydrolase activator NlpD